MTPVLKLDPDNCRAKTLRARIKDVERLKDSGNKLFRSGQWGDAIAKWQDALEVCILILTFYSDADQVTSSWWLKIERKGVAV